MATNTDPKSSLAIEADKGPEANVDKIRDILFGSQMRDYDKRFSRLEERLVKTSETFRDDLKKRFDSLESFVKGEMDSLNERLKNEKSERAETIKGITKEIKETLRTLEKKLSQLDEGTAQAHAELRKAILDQSKNLTKEIDEKHKELVGCLEGEVATLTREKTDRAALADLFTELSLRLKDEFTLPEQ